MFLKCIKTFFLLNSAVSSDYLVCPSIGKLFHLKSFSKALSMASGSVPV